MSVFTDLIKIDIHVCSTIPCNNLKLTADFHLYANGINTVSKFLKSFSDL